nr:protein C1orf43 homolog isoform X2 [Manis javanica]
MPAQPWGSPVRKWPGASGNPGAVASAEPRLTRQDSGVNRSSSARGGAAMASGSNWLSGVNVVLVMAYGSLDLKEEIDIRLSRVQDIKYEPQLLADDDARLLQLDTQENLNCYNYLYRMKALDAIRASEIPFHAEGRHPHSLMGKNFRSYLLDLRNTSTPFKGVRKALIDTLLDGYETARYGTGVFGQSEYLHYQEALRELATVVRARSGSSQRQHQSAAKDLTQSPDVSPTTIQVTYLPSSQKSKRAKHFLELKSFKDNYNTLESTL